jgi:hypothetical protein
MAIWTSERQNIVAVAGIRDDNGFQTGEVLKETAPALKIEEAENKKGATVYRLYEAHIGGYRFVKSFKSLDKAIKFAEED